MQSSSTSLATTLQSSGNLVTTAGRDITIEGSAVNADQVLIVDAKRDLAITTAQDTTSTDTMSDSTTRGLLRFEATNPTSTCASSYKFNSYMK